MNLALLGCDPDSLELVRGLVRPGIELTTAHLVHRFEGELRSISPQVALDLGWETLLLDESLDLVIVGRAADEQSFDDQLRRLVQDAVPLAICHPLDDVLFAYELQMVRDDAGGLLLPYFPGNGHPAIDALAEIAADSSPQIGTPSQLVIERDFPDRSRERVLTQLTRDSRFISQIIGPITDVSAVGDSGSFADLSVVFRGKSGIPARWSIAPVDPGLEARFTLVGETGKAILEAASHPAPWSLRLGDDVRVFDKWNEADQLLGSVTAAKAGTAPSYAWEDACYDLEIGDGIARSLRRKRTIEFGREVRTEEGNFKGMMAAGGCLLLMLAMLILFVSGVIDAIRMPLIDRDALDIEPAPRAPIWIRLWPVYPLAGFLLLQLLLMVAKRSSPKSTGD